MVAPEDLARIKATDKHPEFRAYAIGHEGESNFKVLDHGIGNKTFTWVKRAVGWLNDAIKKGTKVFNQHQSGTNDHTGRIPIGEVMGNKLVELKDKVTTIAAFYIYPEFRDKQLDVASIEADIEFGTDDGGQSFPTSIQNVTGIALSNSEIDSPGFPGATLLASVAAFHGQFNEVKTMNLTELKQAIQEGGYSPSKLFSADQLIADSQIIEHVKKEKHNLYEQNQRLQNDVTVLKEAAVKKDNEHASEVKILKSEGLKGKAGIILDKIFTDRKYTEKQIEYAKSHLSRFQSEATDDTSFEEDLKKFADAEMEDMEKTSELLGVKIDTQSDDSKDKKKSTYDGGINVQREDKGDEDDAFNMEIVPDDENALVPGSKAFDELNKEG